MKVKIFLMLLATIMIEGCQTGPPPKRVFVDGARASITVSSMETRNHQSVFSEQRAIFTVYSDKYGCPNMLSKHGVVESAVLTSDNWERTFDIPVGNHLFVYFRETYKNQLIREWCEGGFVFKPIEDAHYKFRITSNISDMFVEQSCSATLHVKEKGQKEVAARVLPIKLVRGGAGFDQTICRISPKPAPEAAPEPDRCTAADRYWGTCQ
jgi:hypothetical protein